MFRAKAALVLSGAALALTLAGLALVASSADARSGITAPDGAVQEMMGAAFTYQGRLTDGAAAADGAYDFQFRLCDAATGGTPVATDDQDDVAVADGLFTVMLDFGHGAFRGDPRWLEIAVRPAASSGAYATLAPRQALTPAPYALALPAMRCDQAEPSPNVIGGHLLNRAVGVVGATIGGGGREGEVNQVAGDYGTVSGGVSNTVSADWSSIGGGSDNVADAPGSTVAGGSGNGARMMGATVGGGANNTASGLDSVVAGGGGVEYDGDMAFQVPNTASGSHSVVAGGGDNTASGAYASIGGGRGNTAAGLGAAIGGGRWNTAESDGASVGGGRGIDVSGDHATVAGGEYITVTGQWSTVAGGANNSINSPPMSGLEPIASTIGGGARNAAFSSHTTISGGANNAAGGYAATIGGGGGYENFGSLLPSWTPSGNTAMGGWSTVSGGGKNTAWGYCSTVSGGFGNDASAEYGTIGGGGPEQPDVPDAGAANKVTDSYGTVGGGTGNVAGDSDEFPANGAYPTIGGGKGNRATWLGATVAGGVGNTASGLYAAVGGGHNNGAAHDQSVVGGGESNHTTNFYATIGGGANNEASGIASTIAGGSEGRAEALGATVGGGADNWAQGTHATVPGGESNRAVGDHSFAAGKDAVAEHPGSFVWCDTFSLGGCNSTAENEFLARATGGVRFLTGFSDGWSGVRVRPGSSTWESLSDRAVKENFLPVDGREVLRQLAEVPVSTWNYKAEGAAVRHMGPMAQDFYAAFGVGADDKHLSVIDSDGVALAAVQGLAEELADRDERIAALEGEVDKLEARLRAVEDGQRAPGTRAWPMDVLGFGVVGLLVGAAIVGGNRRLMLTDGRR